MDFLQLHNLQNINWPYPRQLGLTWNLKLTIFQTKVAFDHQNRKKIIKKHTVLLFWHILVFVSVLHRMIGHIHSFQLMEWQNLGITTLKYATCVFKKLPENHTTTSFTYITSSNFVIICHLNYWDHINSWKILWKFWNGHPRRIGFELTFQNCIMKNK